MNVKAGLSLSGMKQLNTQVSEKASKIVKDVVTELLIKPSFEKAMQMIRQ